MRLFDKGLSVLVLGMLLVGAAPASASIIYTLDQGSTLGAGNYGTVTVSQVTTDVVQVTVNLASGVGFVNTGLEPFTFTLDGSIPTITSANFSNLTAGFSLNATSPISNDGAGSFQYGLDCTTAVCGTGGNAPFAGPLSFDLTASGLLETSFVSNTTLSAQNSGAFFAVDICDSFTAGRGCSGATGVTYTTRGSSSSSSSGGGGASSGGNIPEPATLALMGLGLLALATMGKRRSARRPRVSQR